jgi:hypothetical protein
MEGSLLLTYRHAAARPAAAAACQSFFYDLHKKLTELGASSFRLLFCWLVGA